MQLSAFVLAVTSILATDLKPAVCRTVVLPVVAMQGALKARPSKQRRKSRY